VIQTTKLRVANLCCAGEEKLILDTLKNFSGIEDISINILSRSAVIKHCNVDCCAPSGKIIDQLNALHLGVSIQDIGANGNGNTGHLAVYGGYTGYHDIYGDLWANPLHLFDPIRHFRYIRYLSSYIYHSDLAKQYIYVSIVVMLFIVGLICYLMVHKPEIHEISFYFFTTSVALGICPILYKCYIAIFMRQTIDINVLIVVAVGGK
jgi:cation transport ATPase